MDDSVAGTLVLSRRDFEGNHTFRVDVTTRGDGMIRLRAFLECFRDGHNRNGSDTVDGCDARSNTVHVILDRTPPSLTLVSPLDGQIVQIPSIAVEGAARDALSGMASLTVNGMPMSMRRGGFRFVVPLPFATNTITVIASDRSGNVAKLQRNAFLAPDAPPGPVFRSPPPTVALIGHPLRQQARVASSNPASVRFSLERATGGMEIDTLTGLITWTPALDQMGEQPVILVAEDATGRNRQPFTVSTMSTAASVSTVISATTGGVLTIQNSASGIDGLSIEFPPGSVNADTEIQISEVVSLAPVLAGAPRLYLRAFHVTPENLDLAVPATITFPYRSADFNPDGGLAVEQFLGLYYVDPSSGRLEGVDGFTVDPANQVVTGTVTHFSTYALTSRARLTRPPGLAACPSGLPSTEIPALLIHGFMVGLGNESTWGRLRELLDGLDPEGDQCVKAWRFDWDSAYVSFEASAHNLAAAIDIVTRESGRPRVNLLAHSFGGIVARTYLQGTSLSLHSLRRRRQSLDDAGDASSRHRRPLFDDLCGLLRRRGVRSHSTTHLSTDEHRRTSGSW